MAEIAGDEWDTFVQRVRGMLCARHVPGDLHDDYVQEIVVLRLERGGQPFSLRLAWCQVHQRQQARLAREVPLTAELEALCPLYTASAAARQALDAAKTARRREQMRAANRRYYARHRAACIARVQRWRQAHPARVQASYRQWVRRTKPLQYGSAQWRKEHPAEWAAIQPEWERLTQAYRKKAPLLRKRWHEETTHVK